MQSSWLEGKIAVFNKKNGYGYLSHPEHDKILVHSRSLGNGVDVKMIYPGLSVRFKIEEVRTGYVARLVTPMEKVETVPETFAPRKVPSLKRKKIKSNDAEIARGPLQESSKPKTASDYIATALAFREQKRYVDARRAFQEGMSQSPSVQLVLSFAALERNLNRPAAAREVYRHGVDLFPESQKLHEDAGALELRIGNAEQAVQYFQRALELSPTKGTRRNLHRFLGSAFFKLSVDKDLVIDNKLLVKAKHNLERARGSLGHREVNLLNRINAILADRNIAKGFRLFEVAGFVVTQISKPGTHGVDFIVEASIEELRTTYGLQEAILVRHLLAGPRPDELRHIDKKLQGLVEEERADPNLAFILLKRSGPMMTALRRRLESGGKSTTIVPIELTANRKNGQPERLRNILDQWLFRRDLYQDNFPVSGSHFFGRERQLKSLFTKVNEGRHVGIFGLRKVGKTSFLWRVRDKSDTDIVAYVDLLVVPSAAKTCDYLFWLIANELAKELNKKYEKIFRDVRFELFGRYNDFMPLLDKPVSLLFDSDLNRVRKVLSSLERDAAPKIVVLIDEVERLLPIGKTSSGFDGYNDFFSYWRGQAQHYQDVVTVITGANAAITEQAQWEGVDNPVYKFYAEEFFPPLDFSECSKMVRELGTGMGVRYGEGALEEIYNLTGGHPFITRRLCSRICKRRPGRPLNVTERMVLDSLPDFMQEDSNLFDEILARLKRDFPNELMVLEAVARSGEMSRSQIKMLAGQQTGNIIHHLIGYQLIRQSGECFTVGIGLLKEYMFADK